MICYNISLYQTLFVGRQQKGVDFMGKDLKDKELGVGFCQRTYGLYTARFVSKRTGKSVQKYFLKLQECLSGMQMQNLMMNMVASMHLVI